MTDKDINACKCYKCHYKGRSPVKGVIHCAKRQQFLDYLFVIAWGCDDFKEKYIDLLKEAK